MIMESQANMAGNLDGVEETDPILGETVQAWHKRGGMYKRKTED